MQFLKHLTLSLLLSLAVMVSSAFAADLENTLYLDVKSGRVTIKLRPDIAPGHVAHIKKLARESFYDGLLFHRVIPGFMAQTGDPKGTGMGSSKYPDLKAEFTDTNFARGVIGMARSPHDINSANSQFFIMLAEGSFLNGDYTVFGEVTDGMEHIDAVKQGTRANNGKVTNPDKMIKLQVAADAQ